VTDQRKKLIQSIMAEAIKHLEIAEQLQYAAHLLREHEDFNAENGVVRRGRPLGSEHTTVEVTFTL
jgi:hypothetical protein